MFETQMCFYFAIPKKVLPFLHPLTCIKKPNNFFIRSDLEMQFHNVDNVHGEMKIFWANKTFVNIESFCYLASEKIHIHLMLYNWKHFCCKIVPMAFTPFAKIFLRKKRKLHKSQIIIWLYWLDFSKRPHKFDFKGWFIWKKIKVMSCNFLSIHIWPYVSKAKMCLRVGILFQFSKICLHFSAVCLQHILALPT